MRNLLKRYSARRDYRVVSSVLTGASVLIPLSVALIPANTADIDLWGLLAFVLSLPFYVGLVVLTYYRFQRAAISSAWLILMVFVFHVGPQWELAGALAFHLSGFIAFVPVIIGLIAPDRDERAPSLATSDAN